MRPISQLVLACALTACAPRRVQVPTPAATEPSDYIDLRPGWRLRVVTPILRSGGYRLQPVDQQASGNTITVSTGTDFLGYETAYYAVRARGRGLRVEFSSAEISQDGKTALHPQPVAHLFQLPRNARYVRLIYLLRASKADHDMAVVGATEMDALDVLTHQVQADPSSGCRSDSRSFCSWIPAGIAVRPEVQTDVDGVNQWVPAR
ncbi:MAG: hypothetical protein JWO48_1789 [Bryobacterales bacterium]|nr:hypothetical protein [Bryobacterales bacterium]